MTAPGKISFFITLGVAAIDMLSCAFISATVLFVMFLVPASSSGSTAAGNQNVLMVHWSANVAEGSIIGLEIGPKTDPTMIWPDSGDTELNSLCARLSKLTVQEACTLLAPGSEAKHGTLEGALAIAEPISGEWGLTLVYADSAPRGNAEVFDDLAVTLTVVGSDASVVDITLAAGEEKSILQAQDADVPTLTKILQIQ
ncbi:hypothetical protein MOV61_08125 [Neorhizobium sp. BETTINA12A]|uniref:hypothetical protein n=1 Tax=Neorhizobium sp. BETTINA12A TaxID=2908924 RepID=UPI001FF60F49|nr:hypothetical protein [Neorhizobium sp. BETTINA12A]MCJ9750681.1 hypothetical protein [Neorhizobium sp. BETTINA12A]